MRIKTCIVVLLTALLVMSASSAEELTVSGRVNAVMYADKALEEHFHRAVPRAHVVGVDPRLERQGSAGKTGSSGMD